MSRRPVADDRPRRLGRPPRLLAVRRRGRRGRVARRRSTAVDGKSPDGQREGRHRDHLTSLGGDGGGLQRHRPDVVQRQRVDCADRHAVVDRTSDRKHRSISLFPARRLTTETRLRRRRMQFVTGMRRRWWSFTIVRRRLRDSPTTITTRRPTVLAV